MAKDKRKSIRRPIRYSAWVILEGDALHGCVLADVSDNGARLDIDETKPIPDNFTLLLSMNGGARRKCRVIWRKPRQIGVFFEGRVNMDPNEAAPPPPEAEAAAAPAEPVKAKQDA